MPIQSYTEQGFGTVVTGTAAEIASILCPLPAPQHDEHCKGYQWELYLQEAREAEARVRAEVRKMIAERNARQDQIHQLAAE